MPSDENKKLYRSKENRIIAGVCGGLGEYFNVDPVLVRVAFILLAFANGFGILLYIVLMIILPLEPDSGEGKEDAEEKPENMPQKAAGSVVFPGFVKEAPVKEAPEKPSAMPEDVPSGGWSSSKKNFIGAVVIIIGLIIFLDNFLPIFSWISWKMVWAVAIILLGYLIIKN